VGADAVEIDMGNVEGSLQKLESKIGILQERPRVFISHASSDAEFAQRLAKDLELQAIEVWCPKKQINAGDLIGEKIRQGIEESQWFLVIISPRTLESDWVSKELVLALRSEKSRGRTFVVPILYKGDEVPPELVDREYIDFRANYQASLRSLAEVLIASMKRAAQEVVSSPLDDVLVALDRGEIDQSMVEEMQQACSLAKWLQGDTTGWYELWEEVRFGDGLRPAVHSALEAELGRIQQGILRPEMPPGYEERLRSLLSP
jgi:hypothetical protein